jgi:hypothetical protein
VKFVTVTNGDSVVAIARNAEPDIDEEPVEVTDGSSEVESSAGSRETGQVPDQPAAEAAADEEQPE